VVVHVLLMLCAQHVTPTRAFSPPIDMASNNALNTVPTIRYKLEHFWMNVYDEYERLTCSSRVCRIEERQKQVYSRP
jgi:hypothetical protein